MQSLKRTYLKHYTRGEWLLPDGQLIYTLELPWRDNAIGRSCIPEAVYTIDRDHTGRHQWYRFRNEETSPRTHIEIHPATYLRHLEGCIAPCLEIVGGDKTREPVAMRSTEACELLIKWFGESSFPLRVYE